MLDRPLDGVLGWMEVRYGGSGQSGCLREPVVCSGEVPNPEIHINGPSKL